MYTRVDSMICFWGGIVASIGCIVLLFYWRFSKYWNSWEFLRQGTTIVCLSFMLIGVFLMFYSIF